MPRATITDLKLKDGAKYKADLSSANTYYPFGMLMPERNWSSEWYRYGFQGQEKDDACAERSRSKIKGEGNSINYTYRMHGPRIGRFFSLDPLAPSYPWNSPYAFSENVVIHAVELEGREKELMFFMDPSLNKYRNTRTSIELKEDKKYYNLGKTNAVSFGIDLAPGIGDVKGLVEVFTGTDIITGEELGVWKWLGLLGLSEFKVIKSADEISEKALKNSENVLSKSQKDAIEGLQNQIKLHKKKLNDYKATPDKFDNKGFLKDVTPERREKIINTRINNLEKQIKTFEKDIQGIKDGTKKALEKGAGG